MANSPPSPVVIVGTLRRMLADMGISGGSTSHAALTGLAADDHTQYHTNARGDARYSLLGHSHSYDPVGTASGLLSAHEVAADPHPQYLTSAEGVAAFSDIGHGHTSSAISDFAESVDDRVAALLVAGTNVTLTYNDAANTLTVAASGGGGGLAGSVTMSVPASGAFEWSESLTATGVTPSNNIILSLGAHVDSDENCAEMLDVSGLEATAGTDLIVVSASFATRTAGAVKLNYMAV